MVHETVTFKLIYLKNGYTLLLVPTEFPITGVTPDVSFICVRVTIAYDDQRNTTSSNLASKLIIVIWNTRAAMNR